MPLATVQKIFNGTTASPRYKTLQALEEVLGGSPDGGSAYTVTSPELLHVGEEPVIYGSSAPGREKGQGEYTLEDYLALPQERRVELIDGTFYDMAAPATPNQRIALEISRQLENFIRRQFSAVPGKPGFDRIAVDACLGKIDIKMSGPAVAHANGDFLRQRTVDFGDHICRSAAVNDHGDIRASGFNRRKRDRRGLKKQQQ